MPAPLVSAPLIEGVEAVLPRILPLFRQLRARRPLVHNITNLVVTNLTANALLAFGASPAMVQAEEEVAEFVALAQALVVNIGTLTAPTLRAMTRAVAAAREHGVPWVLDPVGVGATSFRNAAALELAGQKPSVIRGNAGEIMALARLAGFAGQAAGQKGVDSLSGSDEALAAAVQLSRKTGAVVAVTGERDFIAEGEGLRGLSGGHRLSQDVTGTGCMATALIGACLAVAPAGMAAEAGLVAMKLAAARAHARLLSGPARGPGSFAVALIDSISELHESTPAQSSGTH